MKSIFLSSTFQVSPLILATALLAEANPALSQASNIVPDNTLGAENSVVNPRDETSDSIGGGALRGQNLFHSFQEFNVGENRGVYFANPDAVNNIFSRVTGNNASNILGTLGVDGAADLYLINPNGIVFGENAALDVQGSFTATSADAIEFSEGGLFSAVEPGESLLTISVPLGLQFGSTPGSIINRSFAQDETGEFVGLQVPTGENLTLVGGDINFEAGEATARGGNINIGGLGTAGTVSLSDDGSLSFPNGVERTDVTFSNAAEINVTNEGGGNITIDAQNFNLEAGEFGSSFVIAGISANSNLSEAQAGDITINVAENITIDNSRIGNLVFGIGNSGNISINSSSLELINGSEVSTNILGQGEGNAGVVRVTATDSVIIDGENSQTIPSRILSRVTTGTTGTTGGILIDTSSLFLTNGGIVSSTTFGEGNAGSIKINAVDFITIDGQSSDGSRSGITSQVGQIALGDAGDVAINTGSLSITNGGRVDASTFGQGNAGLVEIAAADFISIDGENSNGIPSGINSQVNSEAKVSAGNVAINTGSLSITNGGEVSASTLGQGNAGLVEITATNSISIDGENSEGFPSSIVSIVNPEAEGNSGDVVVATNDLNLTNGGRIIANTFGQGNAGLVEITATNSISIDGENSEGFPSSIVSIVNPEAEGDARGVNINTVFLSLTNGGLISTNTFSQGDAGFVNITAINSVSVDGEGFDGSPSGISSQVDRTAFGDSREIFIDTSSLSITNGGLVSASTLGQGDAGAIEIKASDFITISGEDSNGFSSEITSQVGRTGSGNAGGIIIDTQFLSLIDRGQINNSTSGEGNAGELKIKANSIELENASIFSGSETNFDAGDIILNIKDSLQAADSSISTSSTQTSGGNLTIATKDIQLRGNSDLTTNVFSGEGGGGNITINANSVLAFDDSDIFAFAEDGQGGNITLNTPAFFAENFTLNSIEATNPNLLENNNRADLNATGAVSSGAVSIPDVSFIQNSLTELPNNSIDTDELVANSCVVPVGDRSQGKFIITGGESLPVRPGGNIPSKYPTGKVRGVTEDNTSSWQPGDPIIEPQGAYRLANGKMVLSRECS